MAADPTGSGFESACGSSSSSSSDDGGIGGVLAGVMIAVVASVGINIGNNMQSLGLKMGAKAECCKKQGEGDPEQPANASQTPDPESLESSTNSPPVITSRVSLAGGQIAEEIARAQSQKPPEARVRRANWLYFSGTFIFFASTFVVFGAMALAPASILAPIESVQFVANIAFARVVNKVQLSRAAVISSFVIVGGVALAVGSGNHVNKSLCPEDLEKYWQSAKWIAYLIGVVTMAAVAQITWFVYEQRRVTASGMKWLRVGTAAPEKTKELKKPPKSVEKLKAALAKKTEFTRDEWRLFGIKNLRVDHFVKVGDFYFTSEPQEQPLPASGTVLPVMYSLSSSMIGSISVLQAKCISELLETLGNGVNVWLYGMTYLVIGLFLSTVGFWLFRLNSALAKYEPLFIIPAIQAGYIFWATLSAGVYFQEFDALAVWQNVLFGVGVVIMFAGLFVLSNESAKIAKKEAASDGKPPEAPSTAWPAPEKASTFERGGSKLGASSALQRAHAHNSRKLVSKAGSKAAQQAAEPPEIIMAEHARGGGSRLNTPQSLRVTGGPAVCNMPMQRCEQTGSRSSLRSDRRTTRLQSADSSSEEGLSPNATSKERTPTATPDESPTPSPTPPNLQPHNAAAAAAARGSGRECSSLGSRR